MQVLVGGIQRFSIEDGPGIRSTVFLKGCPLSCLWCHNPELIQRKNQLMYTKNRCISCGECVQACPKKAISFNKEGFQYEKHSCICCFQCVKSCCTEALHTAAKPMTAEEILEVVLKDRGYYEKTKGGVTFSGGECTQHYEFLNHLMDLCKAEKLNMAIDTSGYCRTEHLQVLAEKADWILYDIKCMDEKKHRALTGVSNRLILSNLRRLAADPSTREKLIIRMPLIGGVNDSAELMEDACRFLQKWNLRTVNLIPYHRLGIAKYNSLQQDYRVFDAPDHERMEKILASFKERGMNVSMLGI